MEELATVIALKPDGVVVQSQVKSSCSQCQQVDNCGSGQVAKAFPQPKLSLEIATKDDYQVGEQVLISIPEQALLSVAWQVYLWPLLGLIVFSGLAQYALSQQLLNNELLVIVIGMLGGFLGFRLAKNKANNQQTNHLLMPTIKERVIPAKQS